MSVKFLAQSWYFEDVCKGAAVSSSSSNSNSVVII